MDDYAASSPYQSQWISSRWRDVKMNQHLRTDQIDELSGASL